MALIERDALLAAYDATHKGPPGGARKLIEEAQAVDAVPVVHAQWVDIPDHPQYDQKMCSACGDYFCCQNSYCPNCGAKMDGERGENDA